MVTIGVSTKKEFKQKRLLFGFILSLFFITPYSQTTKGLVESTDVPISSAESGSVYALIVGVSNYPYVKPLNFAEEDALLFFEFLRSKAGGEVPENHIKLLLNEQATHANVTAGLAWLNNSLGAQPKPGDRVYIYLSGHGDAYDASEAYYLCYDSNPAGDKNNYQLGGALDIGKMKKRVAAMVSKSVEVILVVDACRSGDVPGVRSGIGNPYQSVIEEPVGEVLLLSAGANQFALEDRRWGGGHGGFTWYLIKGLSGEADSDQDGMVSLIEVESYTKMKVFGDTKQMGSPQTPHFCCDNKFDCVLSKKDEVFSQRIRAEESGNTKVGLTALAARDALEKAMFEKEELKQAYFKIKKACKEQRYLGNNSAWSIWEDCKGKYTAQEIEPIRMYLMGALAAEGQKAINQEMNVSLGNSPGYAYYHSRREWVEHAIRLMAVPDEIAGITSIHDFIYALELSNSVSDAFPILDSVIYLYNDQLVRSITIEPYEKADSLFKKLEKEYLKSAVFHYLLQEHQSKWEYYLPGVKDTNRKKEIGKSIELAPKWAKPLYAAMSIRMFSNDEISERLNAGIIDDPENFEYYYLSYYHNTLQLPLNRNKVLDYLQKAFELHPNPRLTSLMVMEKFANFGLFLDLTGSSMLEKFYTPGDKEWVILKEIMEHYYNGKFYYSEGKSDSTFNSRAFMTLVIPLAVRLNHCNEALEWIRKDNALCMTGRGLMMESVIMEYAFSNKQEAAKLDEEALRSHFLGNFLLESFGVSKENLSELESRKLLYYYLKLYHLPEFFRDDWVVSELADFENFCKNYKDGFLVTTVVKAFLRDHIELKKSKFEKWNEQLEYVRREENGSLAWRLFLYGVMFYEQVDSTVIFLNDSSLLSRNYAASFPRGHIGIPLILSIPKESSILYLDSALKAILSEWQIDTTLFFNFLGLSKSNKRFKETLFFKNFATGATTIAEKKLLYYIYLKWEDYEGAAQVLDHLPWGDSNEGIPPSFLLEMIQETIKCANFQFVEKAMDKMIPYAFHSNNYDYSDSVEEIDSFFFTHTRDGEALRRSPEYQRLLKKYVIE